MSRIAILGAGKLGVTLAQLAVRAGHDVVVASSREPAAIELTMSVLAPGSTVAWAAQALEGADLVILAAPLGKFRSLAHTSLREALVIDAMNYWWEVDGRDSEFAHLDISSSEYVRDQLGLTRVVKGFNHMGYHDLTDYARAPGSEGRLALAVAGDDPDDRASVADLVNELGFDPLELDSLAAGKVLEPGHPAFGAAVPLPQLRAMTQ